MAQTLDEYNLLEIDFDFGLSNTAPGERWRNWILKLGLSVNKANEIYRYHELVRDNGTELEKLNSYAKVSALTLKAEKYSDGVDSILSAILVDFLSFDERVKLNVWRHILKVNEVDNPKEEWQVIRNQQLLAKIAQIDLVLGQKTGGEPFLTECEHLVVEDSGVGSQESNDGQQRPGINGKRDADAAKWYKTKKPEEVEKMTIPQIHTELKARDTNKTDKIWKHGFPDWNRTQLVYPKKKPGRKSGK